MSLPNLLDFCDLRQDAELHELREELARLKAERERTDAALEPLHDLAERVAECQLRQGLLVRLLIGKGLLTAAEYAALIATAHQRPSAPPDPPANSGAPVLL